MAKGMPLPPMAAQSAPALEDDATMRFKKAIPCLIATAMMITLAPAGVGLASDNDSAADTVIKVGPNDVHYTDRAQGQLEGVVNGVFVDVEVDSYANRETGDVTTFIHSMNPEQYSALVSFLGPQVCVLFAKAAPGAANMMEVTGGSFDLRSIVSFGDVGIGVGPGGGGGGPVGSGIAVWPTDDREWAVHGLEVGLTPAVPLGASITFDDYDEVWHQVAPGLIQLTQRDRHYTVDGEVLTQSRDSFVVYDTDGVLPGDEVRRTSNIRGSYNAETGVFLVEAHAEVALVGDDGITAYFPHFESGA